MAESADRPVPTVDGVIFAPDGTAANLVGPAGAPAVALIHGLGLCRRLWDPHVAALAEHYRVVTYDLYGHGESAPVPAQASLALYAEQLGGVLDHLGIDIAAVVGFSIGGMINRRFAFDHAGRVRALAILNAPHDRGEAAQAAVEARARTVREQGPLATMDAALARWFTPGFRAMQPEALQLVRDWRLAADPESYAQAAWVLAHGVLELAENAPPITAPTLVMTSQNDSGSTPAMADAIAGGIPGAETVVVPGLQHLGLMEDPGAFTVPILDFLSRRAGPR